jgi:low temperature requirement protein LtrA
MIESYTKIIYNWHQCNNDFGIAFYHKDDIRLDFNPNVHHFNERFEAIVLIMLGETILGIIPNLEEVKEDDLLFRRTIGCIIMGYAAMFLYKTFHFDVEAREGEAHAVYLGGIRKCIWIYATIMECVGILLFGASYGELIEGVMKFDDKAIGHIHKSNELMAVGMSVALGANLIARRAHKLVLEDFYYAWELYVAQNLFQVMAICLVAPLCHMFSESFLLEHPYVRSLYICCILFALNVLFFIDEILQFKFLQDNVRREAAHLSALEHKSKDQDKKDIPVGGGTGSKEVELGNLDF